MPLDWMETGDSMMGWVARKRYDDEQRSRWLAAVAAQQMAAWGDEVIPVAGTKTPTVIKTDMTSGTLRLGPPGPMTGK